MPFVPITDIPYENKICMSSEHLPPTHIVLPPGKHKWA